MTIDLEGPEVETPAVAVKPVSVTVEVMTTWTSSYDATVRVQQGNRLRLSKRRYGLLEPAAILDLAEAMLVKWNLLATSGQLATLIQEPV